MNWKILSLTLASLMGIGATVGITVLVMKQGRSTDPPMRGALRGDDSAAERLRRTRPECRELAQSKVRERTGEVLKDSAIGALIGAGTGSAGGAIADGGSGAGKGAAIGAVVGAVGGAVFGAEKNSKEAVFKRAYDGCMGSRR
jgi:uncharacterized protein YcfJ